MKFPIPKTVEIGPHEISVSVTTIDEAGEFSPAELSIRINENLKPSVQLEVFAHEVAEAANWCYELNLPHRTIQILGAVYSQAIKSAR